MHDKVLTQGFLRNKKLAHDSNPPLNPSLNSKVSKIQ